MFLNKLRIKEIRKKYGLTQKEVADIIGASVIRYFLCENKVIKLYTSETARFCQHFNISSDFLLGLSDEYKKLY